MANVPGMPPAAQAAAVRQMLLDDSTLTLEGIKTTHPYLEEGVKLVLKEGQNPRAARSGSGPMPSLNLKDEI